MIENSMELVLVEDNPNDLDLVLHALRKSGLKEKIQVLRDGAEALEYMFCEGKYADRSMSDVPKVILLDIKLPKVNGLELLERLKASERTRAIPVVMFTSSRQERDVDDSYQFGVNSYVVKPVDSEEFTRVVAQLKQYWLETNEPPPEPIQE
ncbi:MAG: response regulator [Anaerolineales bacterium]